MIALQPGPVRVRTAAFACALALCACGGSQSEAPAAQGTTAQAARAALPADPLALVPAGPRELASVDLAQLRGSHHFATLDRFARDYGCFNPEPAHFLLQRTERALMASYGASAGQPNARRLVLLRGQYQAGDARRALEEAHALLTERSPNPVSPPPVSEQADGRFQRLEQGPLSAVQLDPTLLALGDTSAVRAALAVADGKQPAFTAKAAIVSGIDSAQWLTGSGHTFAALTQVDAESAARLGRQLTPIGGRKLGEGFTESTAAIAVVLGSDLRVRAHVQYTDPNAAAAAAQGLRSVIGRAGFVIQLMGLPSALERTEVTTDGARMNVSLTVTPEELQQTFEQLEPVLRGNPQPCAARVQAPVPPASSQPAGASVAAAPH